MEMEASDMLDVLHFYFEDDFNYSSAEQAEAHGKVREGIYKELYGVDYRYASKSSGSKNGGVSTASGSFMDDELGIEEDSTEEVITPLNPKIEKPKQYVPPTSFNPDSSNPFGDILDSPIG